MSTPPDFGGREIEEGMQEDLGGPRPDYGTVSHQDRDSTVRADNEAHAAGKVCARCRAVITPSQDVRRRADGQWVHEVCP